MSDCQKSPARKANEEFLESVQDMIVAGWHAHRPGHPNTEFLAKREMAARKMAIASSLVSLTPAPNQMADLIDKSVSGLIKKANEATNADSALTYTKAAIALASLRSR